jgi:hypothetical protein
MPPVPTRSFRRSSRTAGPGWRRLAVGIALGLLASGPTARGTAYAVEASATTSTSPAQVTLSWTAGSAPANGYAVSRKDPGATSWTPLVNLVGSALGYTDTNVTAGRVYEYQIVRQTANFTGHGYVAAGIDAPAPDSRGRIILVIERSIIPALTSEISRLARDLAGDGWTPVSREVGREDSPASVRDAIRSAANEDRANTRAVLLLGRVPVARAGNLNVDGHGGRPLPADVFYGDLDGNWPDTNGDGVLDPGTLPSDVDLMVGRVDFADMASFGSETDLLRRYLDKNHAYRHGLRRVAARALIGDRLGDFSGDSFSAAGFRNFSALLGPNRITTAAVEDNSPVGDRWITKLAGGDWLLVYGGGGGSSTTVSGLGTHGIYSDLHAADFVERRARGQFYLLFGSWFVEWNQPDNLLRAALATPDLGLTALWAGRPQVFLHHMAVGEPIGHGVRLSQNNSSLYASHVNRHTRGIHLALLGDPTLRLQVVAPPSGLQIGPGGGSPTLTWTSSPEATEGYHVYRGSGEAGPFARVTVSPVPGATFTDYTAPVGTHIYQVRAVRRESSGGGTYFNTSQGVFATATVTNPTPVPNSPAPGGGTSGGGSGQTPATGGGASGTSSAGGGGAHSPGMLAVLMLLVALRRRKSTDGVVH